MKRCVIVGCSDITAYDRINGIITGEDYVIFCDRLSKRNICIAVVKEKARRADKNDESRNRGDEETSKECIRKEG
ncbi:MAG: hypothetical protein E7607_03630 [Ruminococcaceae bacterium]|nr:hypothetical protein [Oscillospiraceae bacterium]